MINKARGNNDSFKRYKTINDNYYVTYTKDNRDYVSYYVDGQKVVICLDDHLDNDLSTKRIYEEIIDWDNLTISELKEIERKS